MGQLSSWKRHLPPFVVVFKSLLAPNAREILKYKWKTKSVGKKIDFRSKSFSNVLVQGKHHLIIFQSNYIGTKNLKYWTRTMAGNSGRLVQLKHFSTVNMRSGETVWQDIDSNAVSYWTLLCRILAEIYTASFNTVFRSCCKIIVKYIIWNALKT